MEVFDLVFWKRLTTQNQSADDGGLEESAYLTVKNIGKPCAGKPHARFDAGELVTDTINMAIQ